MNSLLNQKFYTVKETMKLIDVSRLTVYRYIKSKKLKAYKFWLEYRVLRTDLEQFIHEAQI